MRTQIQQNTQLRLKQAVGYTALPLISLKVLLKNGRECLIDHEGATYNLRLTRNNKLILTK